MNVLRFVAPTAAEVVRQIRSQLGAEAVVISVKQLPAEGLGRFWGKPRLEVLAGLPEPRDSGPVLPSNADQKVNQVNVPGIAGTSAIRNPQPCEVKPFLATEPITEYSDPGPTGLGGNWRSAAVLHQMGLQPLQIEKVIERARAGQGRQDPPSAFSQELALVRSTLAGFWRPAPRTSHDLPVIHIFVGPPGSGKTTALCKWLAKSVLGEGCKARAWRLDSRAANFAGLLDFYGEILGVEIGREWKPVPAGVSFDVGFVDLPGMNVQDTAACEQLRRTLAGIPGAQIHLVLNAAYDVSVLLAQVRAFAGLPVTDLIFTHLDEEKRRGKLWNFILGTSFAIRFLSGGQNIPGDFSQASAEMLGSR